MFVTQKIRGKKDKILSMRELVALNEINDLDYCLNMIENVVNNTISPLEQELHNQIKELEHKYEVLETKYNAKLESIKELKENINDLRYAMKLIKSSG